LWVERHDILIVGTSIRYSRAVGFTFSGWLRLGRVHEVWQMQKTPIFTIGYSSRTMNELIAILQQHAIRFLIDVRSHPYSRFRPEFLRNQVEDRLKQCSIQYVFLGDKLGGRPEDKSCYTNGKVDYEKCREKRFYHKGIARLRTAWQKDLPVVLMCSEAKPEECHRSKLIGATLVEDRIDVLHIDETGMLRTQDQVIQRLTRSQTNLFGAPLETLTSRRKYLSPGKEAFDSGET
jgi:uncharacterized protein (DUF488 family)